jgi:hypothetical protein
LTVPETNYKRYGLQLNPFYEKLDPLSRAEDATRFARVAGFGKLLERVDQLIADRVAKGAPAALLICGGSGSGRTAMAQYALWKYRELRKIRADRFFVPQLPLHDFMAGVIRSWMIDLGGRIEDAPRIDIGEKLARSLGAAELGKIDDKVLEDELKQLAKRTANSLQQQPEPAGFGVLLKSLRKPEQFGQAVNMFSLACTIVVATDSETSRLEGELAPCQQILAPVSSVEIPLLVGQRWDGFGATAPNPFDADGLTEAFSEPHPIEKALRVIGNVLESRLASFPKGDPWPDDPQLRMDKDFILREVGIHLRDWRAIQ